MAQPLHTVLIGTSLDGESDPVVRTGVELARLHGATVYLAHAYDQPPTYAGAPPEQRGVDAGWVPACRALDAQAARVGPRESAAGPLPPPILRPGAPQRVLQDLASELDADLVVLGHAHGSPLGPVIDRAVRSFGCPVLIVHETARVPPARILAAVDLSPASAQMLRRGLEILSPRGAAPPDVEVLHVLPSAGGERATRLGIQRRESLARQALYRCLGRRGKLAAGDPDHEIVAEAEAWGADVVLVGTHARTRFDRFLLGSVAQGVLRWAPCAVLVLPPRAVAGLEIEAATATDRMVVAAASA
jgi:nucleotide-binding universal stress UspA family protein